MKYRLIILSAMVGLILSGCGQYGRLYLPGTKSETIVEKNYSDPTVTAAIQDEKT